jgi:hypothetical protein
MGSFTPIILLCPGCDAKVELQSKSGPLPSITKRVKQVTQSRPPFVPIEVAVGVLGDKETCPQCGIKLEVRVPGIERPTVQLALELVEPDEDDDDDGPSAYGAES